MVDQTTGNGLVDRIRAQEIVRTGIWLGCRDDIVSVNTKKGSKRGIIGCMGGSSGCVSIDEGASRPYYSE
jgi:hypothetical protein